MAAFDGYRVKDRSGKVAKRRSAMPVNGKSVFVIQAVIGKKATAVKRKAAVK